MRYWELIRESVLNGLHIETLEQFVDGEEPSDEDITDESSDELEESILDEAEFGLGAKYRNASDKEMQEYLGRIGVGKKGKLDKYNLPYIHASNIKKLQKEEGTDGPPIVDENDAPYDLADLKRQITKRPKKILNQNEKMRHSGKAVVYYSVGLPALTGLAVNEQTNEFAVVKICKNAGICKTYCYAMKSRYIMFPASSMNQSRILNFLLNDPEGFKSTLISEISAAQKKWAKFSDKSLSKGDVTIAIRWHDAGDFFSEDYTDLAWSVAREFPELDFYAYTKESIVATDPNKPENFKINFSEGATPSQTKQINLTKIKNSRVVPKEMFSDLVAKKDGKPLKDADGATQFASLEAAEECKERIAKKYNVDIDTILTYSEYSEKKDNKEMGEDLNYWNVIVLPGNGDTSANDAKVLTTFLLFH